MSGGKSVEHDKGQFSGHETFPLRQLWLRKAFDAVVERGRDATRALFAGPDAIVTFGVGKNMALAIRHWALACGVLTEAKGSFKPTELAQRLLGGSNPWDPYLENPATAWLLHWQLAGSLTPATTWHLAFNYFVASTFDREALANAIARICEERGWKGVAEVTIKRDVECFMRSYVARDGGSAEESMEGVLTGLGLLRAVGSRTYEFRRGPKPALPDAVFNHALDEFWERQGKASSLSVESIAYTPGSPGRVFKLDEESVVDRLVRISETSGGCFTWSDSAGIRQVLRIEKPSPLQLLKQAYVAAKPRKAA